MAIPPVNAKLDKNNKPTMMGVSTADGVTPVPVEVDPVTGALLVSGATGGGAAGPLSTSAKGTTTIGSPTSTDASADRQLLDVTLRDTTGNPVAVGGGTQYVEGVTATTGTGTLIEGKNGTTIKAIQTDPSGNLVVTGNFYQATQPVSGTVTANTGLTPLTDTQLRAVAVPVSLASAPTTPVTGTFFQATQPVSGGSTNAGTTTGNFTFTAADIVAPAPDGTGLLITGTPTAGSVTPAFVVADGMIGSLFLIKGLTASQTAITIYFEGSANSTNGSDGDWIELKQRRTGTQPGVETADYKTQANGYFRGNCADFKWLRARLLGTFSGTPTAQIWTSAGQGATFLNSGLPSSGSIIGKVGIDQTTPGTTNLVAISGTVPVSIASVTSTVNSTAVALAANGVFTGTSEDITQYSAITVTVFTDQVSATDGLSMQQSSNGTNWDNLDNYTVPANTGKTFSVLPAAKFFRLVYTNGATLQTALRIQTTFRALAQPGQSVRPQDGRGNDNDMSESIAYSMVYNGTSWDRARGTNGSVSTLTSDGINTSNVVASDTGQNAQLIAGNRKEVSFTTTIIQAVASTDVSNYRSVSVHIVTQGTSSVVGFQASNDNVNWVAIAMHQGLSTISAGVSTVSSAGVMYFGNISYRYFRLNITGITAGTTAGVIEFGAMPVTFASIGVSAAQNGAYTVTPTTPTAFNLKSAATTNATSIKATAGTVYSVTVSNTGAAAAFVKLFNTTAAPTVGTTIPDLTIPVAASGLVSFEYGALGLRYGTGIALSITNLVADTDATAIVANQVKVMISYI